MHTRDVGNSLSTLFAELTEGAPLSAADMLNRGDPGLLRSLEKLSATAASKPTGNGSSIAAHDEHLRYGLSLMNRWAAGENPFETADWSVAWRKTRVSAAEWKKLRDEFGGEARRWLAALKEPREMSETDSNTVIGSIAHLAYHVGAIRQIDLTARGPSAND